MGRIKVQLEWGCRSTGEVGGHCDVAATAAGTHFGVHREMVDFDRDKGAPVFGRRWVVTHRRSGRIACMAPTKKSAIHAAELLAAVAVDWDSITPANAGSLTEPARTEIKMIRVAAIEGATP